MITARECPKCWLSFTGDPRKKFCSTNCGTAYRRRVRDGYSGQDSVMRCDRCSVEIPDARVDRKRCADCSGKTTPVFTEQVCANQMCGITFTPFKAGQQSCGNSCAQKVWKAANRKSEPWDDRRRANSQKRRALKLMLPSENVIAQEVFERDCWICGICDLSVDESLIYPDPNSPSLDHVVPLARGGHHTYQNTQLAHLRCNLSKGDRVDAVNI